MKPSVFKIHERLQACPPALFLYIVYRRLVEQGPRVSWLWVKDKLVRRMRGYSPPELSQVTDLLFVGGQHGRRGLHAMRALGIRAVVNLRQEWDDGAHGLTLDDYLWLPVVDDTEPTLEQLAQGADFIHQQIEQGHGVYIHCAAGVGRAPTMAVAYLISRGDSVEQAWERVCQRRPFVRPTPPQEAITRAFAERIQVRSSSPPPALAAQPAVSYKASADDQGHQGEREQWLQRTLEQLAEDPRVTDPLPDDAAQTLLSWAQEQLVRLWEEEGPASRMPATQDSMIPTAPYEELSRKVQALRRRMRHLAALSAAADEPTAMLREILRSEPGKAITDATPTSRPEVTG